MYYIIYIKSYTRHNCIYEQFKNENKKIYQSPAGHASLLWNMFSRAFCSGPALTTPLPKRKGFPVAKGTCLPEAQGLTSPGTKNPKVPCHMSLSLISRSDLTLPQVRHHRMCHYKLQGGSRGRYLGELWAKPG